MSTNMHGIVEGVERLVESDTYENAPLVPDQLDFASSANNQQQRAISAQLFDPAVHATRQTPIAPPGLGPPNPTNQSASLSRIPSSQSYTPRPALPGIMPSIWNTAFSPEAGNASSPRTPPGLRPPMALRSANSPSYQQGAQDLTNDLLLRQGLLAHSQLQGNPLNGHSPISPWLSAPGSAMHHQHAASSAWERDSFAPNPFSQRQLQQPVSSDLPSQPISSGLVNASWVNDAFLASTMSSGVGFQSPGLGNPRKHQSAQFGAIGRSPRLGHGG